MRSPYIHFIEMDAWVVLATFVLDDTVIPLAGGQMCIVQLDDFGVGFCDAKPCKAALGNHRTAGTHCSCWFLIPEGYRRF